MRILLFFLSAISLAVLAYSCGSDDPSGPGSVDFDRQSMLANWADNIIIPAFESFSVQTEQLSSATDAFTADPTLQRLNGLRQAWEEAYLSFQHVSMFEMGIAMELGSAGQLNYRDQLNIYPTDTDEIHVNIEEGSYNLELPSLNDSQGFPALDYLLHGLAEDDSEILEFYTNDPDAENYQAYLLDLTGRIDELTRQVADHWTEEFRDEFVQNSRSGSNASVDRMVNDYIFYYEKALRAGKVGIPAGVFSG